MYPAIPDFNFIGFIPDDDLRFQANCTVEELLDLAPYGAIAVSLLEKSEDTYRCSIEIYSHHGPFTASSSSPSPKEALETVLGLLAPRLKRWNEVKAQSRVLRKRILGPLAC